MESKLNIEITPVGNSERKSASTTGDARRPESSSEPAAQRKWKSYALGNCKVNKNQLIILYSKCIDLTKVDLFVPNIKYYFYKYTRIHTQKEVFAYCYFRIWLNSNVFTFFKKRSDENRLVFCCAIGNETKHGNSFRCHGSGCCRVVWQGTVVLIVATETVVISWSRFQLQQYKRLTTSGEIRRQLEHRVLKREIVNSKTETSSGLHHQRFLFPFYASNFSHI